MVINVVVQAELVEHQHLTMTTDSLLNDKTIVYQLTLQQSKPYSYIPALLP